MQEQSDQLTLFANANLPMFSMTKVSDKDNTYMYISVYLICPSYLDLDINNMERSILDHKVMFNKGHILA